MIEDLLYRIESTADTPTAEAVIERLPIEHGLVLDLFFIGEISRTDIACLLGWSPNMVSQRLIRGISLVKLALKPEAFSQAQAILRLPLE